MNINFKDKEILLEHLGKAHALLRAAAHNPHFGELSTEIIHDYLWAAEDHIQLMVEQFQKMI